MLDRGAQAGSLREQEVAFVAQVLDDLPALAWGESPPREAPAAAAEEAEDVARRACRSRCSSSAARRSPTR